MALPLPPSKKTERIDIRLSRELKHKLQRAAELEGIPLSSFVIQSAVERADDVILRNVRIIELSGADHQPFAEWLLNPPGPTRDLIEALRTLNREVAQDLERQ